MKLNPIYLLPVLGCALVLAACSQPTLPAPSGGSGAPAPSPSPSPSGQEGSPGPQGPSPSGPADQGGGPTGPAGQGGQGGPAGVPGPDGLPGQPGVPIPGSGQTGTPGTAGTQGGPLGMPGGDGSDAAGSDTSGAGGGWPDSGADGESAGGGQASSQTGAGDRAEDEFERSLGDFDGIMQSEQEAIARAGGGTAADEGLADSGGAGGMGRAGGPEGQGDASTGLPGAESDELPGGMSRAEQEAMERVMVEGCDDADRIARQLCEAATREEDPFLRAALWNEYNEYRRILRGR